MFINYTMRSGAGHTLLNSMERIGSQPIVAHVQDESSFDVINRYRRKLVGEICRQTKPGTSIKYTIIVMFSQFFYFTLKLSVRQCSM